MRAWLVVLLLLPFVPVVQAQSDGTLGDDDAGDQTSPAGLPTPPGVEEIDLRALGMREDPTAFYLDITVDALETTMAPGVILVAHEVDFEHNGRRFVAMAQRSNLAGTTDFFGYLHEREAGQSFTTYLQELEVVPDFPGARITLVIPREAIRDPAGAPPAPGRTLEAFSAASYADRLLGDGIFPEPVPEGAYWQDRLPDEGVLDAVHEVRFGVASTGHLSLASDEPFRASNGEATTFVFRILAKNNGGDDTVRFGATGFPTGWDVTLPSDQRLAAGAEVKLAVIVRTAFAHSHGSTDSFVLSMTSGSEPSAVGRLELGVHYPLIPQPAGHHDRLWIHSYDHTDDVLFFALATAISAALSQTGLMQDVFLNAIEKDDRADETPSEGRKCQLVLLDPDYPTGTGYCWELPLNPGLQMGLDFDLAREGELSVSITARVPMPAASLEGELVHLGPPELDNPSPFAPRTETVLALINRTAPVDLLLGEAAVFTAPIVPTAEADLVEYQRGAGLELRLRLLTIRPDTWLYGPAIPAPMLAAGGEVVLPLNEYADPVTEFIDLGAKGLRVVPLGEQERSVNPGRTVVFRAEIDNEGNATDVALDLIGGNRDWARLLGQDRFTLRAGHAQGVAIAVTAPKGAFDEEKADLVLQVTSLDDASQRSLVRFVAHVDTDADWPDEAAWAEELAGSPSKGAPGFGVIALLAAIALALRRR